MALTANRDYSRDEFPGEIVVSRIHVHGKNTIFREGFGDGKERKEGKPFRIAVSLATEKHASARFASMLASFTGNRAAGTELKLKCRYKLVAFLGAQSDLL
jgi:hypothetical protein